jgi:transcriptional regulator with XRE-family HTH domain
MDAARVLRQARRRTGLTQRELAGKAGVPQSQVAKIESGAVVPRVDTLDRLLDACGEGLESLPRPGRGVDRTLFTLDLPPAERARIAVESDRNMMEVMRRVRRATRVRSA